MLSKISNTATKADIEVNLNAIFDYEYLYQPSAIINGKKEASVCMVTAEAPRRVQFGIWGILPKNYMGSWKKFQTVHNTLEVSCESVPKSSWLFEPLTERRCLIVATGFFSNEIDNQELKSVKTTLKDKSIFCFAGIYNVLEDGFITCSILTRSTAKTLHHLNTSEPIIIPPENYQAYLAGTSAWQDTCASAIEINPSELEQQVLSKNFLHLI